MGVYIKGMEMPENGWKHIMVTSDGKAYRFEDFTAGNTATRYEAVEVPQHGRLIDADILETHEYYDGEWQEVVYKDDIDNVPTVIPSDKDGEI